MLKWLFILPVALVLNACTSRKDVSHIAETNTGLRDTTGGQKQMLMFSDSLISMPISGKAHNQKGGAVLITSNDQTYWIDGLSSWDDTFLDQPVRVWGDVIVRNDNPVFLDTGKIVSQGIPVETEEELNAQQNRSWILNARYELIRP